MRNTLYADAAPRFVRPDGVIRAPAGHGRVAWVARADVARLAAVLLTEPGHEGQIYDVSGPHAIEHLTGQRPMTLSEFLAAEPSSFAHLT